MSYISTTKDCKLYNTLFINLPVMINQENGDIVLEEKTRDRVHTIVQQSTKDTIIYYDSLHEDEDEDHKASKNNALSQWLKEIERKVSLAKAPYEALV